MKKLFLLTALFLSAFNITLAQEDGTLPPEFGKDDSHAKKVLSVNALGILQFGPSIQGELRLGQSKTYLVPHVRYQFLGILTHVFFANQGYTFVSPNNVGGGLSVQFLFPSSYNRNAAFVSTGLEYNQAFYGGFLEGYQEEQRRFFQGLAIIAHGGYRWRRTSGKNFSAGVRVGMNTTLSDVMYPISDPSATENVGGGTLAILMLDLSFGFESY